MAIEPIELTPNPSNGVPALLKHPAPGSDLDAANLARYVSQPLLDAVAYLQDQISLDYSTYGRGRDGSIDVSAAVPLLLDRDLELETIRFLDLDAEVFTNGFTLKARTCIVAEGCTKAVVTSENYSAQQSIAYGVPGSYTFTVPAGMTTLAYLAAGGNGGGGSVSSGLGSSKSRGGRGGPGAVNRGSFTVAPGDVITIEIGEGGKGGETVAVGPYTPPTLDGGPGGGQGGKATRIYRNGALKVGVPGGGGGGAGSSVTTVGTTPSTSSSQPTYGFEGGKGGTARMASVTSGSTHNGEDGDAPSSYALNFGTGGEDANDTLTGGSAAGSPSAASGTSTHPVSGEFGRGGFLPYERVGQGGWGGENGNPAAASKTGGGGGRGQWIPEINYVTAAGGGGGGVGFLAGDVTSLTNANRGVGQVGGTPTNPNGKDGDPGYLTIYGIPTIVTPSPGSLSAGQNGGDGTTAVPPLPDSGFFYGGRGGSAGGEGSASAGVGNVVAKAAGTARRISGPGAAPGSFAGLGGVKGAGASGGFGGYGASHNSVAFRTIIFEETAETARLFIQAAGDDGEPGVAATGDGGGGGGGGGPCSFWFHEIRRTAGSLNTVETIVRSRGGTGGAGGSGTDTSNRGGGGGQGGEAGPVHLWCTACDAYLIGYSGVDPWTRLGDTFANKLTALNPGYTDVALTYNSTGSGSNAATSSPWAGGVGGTGQLRQVIIQGAILP